MKRWALAVALIAAACAFIPPANRRLDEARAAYRAAAADEDVLRFASHELEEAREALEQASRASDTLQDPAEVDHLAYLARQRAAISREVAAQRAFEAGWSRP
jgi:DnaJ-domain-containing protein 1